MKKTRIIGIDFGLQRIGVASSDESKIIASPLQTLKCGKKMEDTLKLLIAELEKDQKTRQYSIHEVVVGLPLMMSGKSGLMADEARHFADELKNATGWNIVTWDERLTSVQAERSMMEGSMTRKKRSQRVDTVAAVIILQNYLDRRGLQQDSEK